MAARFAVTTGNWTGAIWAATSGGAAGSAAVPTSSDDVTINQDVVVTLDATTCVANSVVVSARTSGTNGGKIDCATGADTKLVVQQGITTTTGSTQAYSGKLLIDMSAAAGYKCELYTNNANATGAGYTVTLAGDYLLKGAAKTSYTYTQAALTGGSSTSVTVDDATGWRVGDKLVFCTTQAFSQPTATINNVTWAGGYLTCTTSAAHGYVAGDNVVLTNLQTALSGASVSSGLNWVVYDCPTTTTFRIAMADPTVSDTAGFSALMPKTDLVTIATVDTGTGAITWSDGNGAGGSVAHDHADNCIVANFTRNVVFGPATAGNTCSLTMAMSSTVAPSRCIRDVEFRSCLATTTSPTGIIRANGTTTGFIEASNCAFYDYDSSCFAFGNPIGTTVARSNNVYYTSRQQNAASACVAVGTTYLGSEESPVILRSIWGFSALPVYSPLLNPKISGTTGSSNTGTLPMGSAGGVATIGGGIWSCRWGVYMAQSANLAETTISATRLGCGPSVAADYPSASNGATVNVSSSPGSLIIDSCVEQVSGTTLISSGTTLAGLATVTFRNRDNDPTAQEVYYNDSSTLPVIVRDNAVYSRASSSIRFDTLGSSKTFSLTFPVLAKANQALKLLIYARKNAAFNDGTNTRPTAALSGLGITPVTATMTDVDDTWELLDLSYASGAAPTADGELTLTLSCQSSTAAAKAYFSGLPSAPYITRCRHYGYVFDETTMIRTVDSLISAAYATADAYTGMSITWNAAPTSSTVQITADNTFQKLYDHVCAKAIANVDKALPLTGAGVAGSPALFAAGNITVDTTKVLNGAGSVSMGSYTLTTETASAQSYTYTGGTWSQLTTVPTVNGGTMALSGEGTWTFTVAASTILTFAPTANAVTYVMGGSTITGTLDLRNTHGTRTITVELPSGASYTTANNTGATITVTTPQLYQSVTVTGATAGSRIQIYDTTSSTELYNGTPSFPYTWTDGSPAAGDRAIRLRVSYVSGVTAKTFIEASIGTCGTTSGDKDISYLVNQTNDATYNANALNGQTIYGAGEITFTDSSPDVVNIDVAANTVSLKSIYAAWCWYAFTSAGIATDIDYIDAIDTANYVLSNMKIKNTSSPTVPLEVTGGYAVDETTGASIDLADTTGGTLIFAPDHVVAYATGSGPLTAGQAIELTAAASAAAAAAASTANLTYSGTAVKADIQKVLGTVIQTGSSSTASIGY